MSDFDTSYPPSLWTPEEPPVIPLATQAVSPEEPPAPPEEPPAPVPDEEPPGLTYEPPAPSEGVTEEPPA